MTEPDPTSPDALAAPDPLDALPPLDADPPWLRLVVPALALTVALMALGAFMVTRQRAAEPPAGASGGAALVGFALDPPRAAPDFTLTGQTGAPLRLSDLRGRAVLLFFGFTSCPDVCPTTLLAMARALDAAGPAGARVTPLFVSIDPDRDTPAVLAAYTAGYDPRIVAATADIPTLEQVAADYGIQFQKVEPPNQAMIDNFVDAHFFSNRKA